MKHAETTAKATLRMIWSTIVFMAFDPRLNHPLAVQ